MNFGNLKREFPIAFLIMKEKPIQIFKLPIFKFKVKCYVFNKFSGIC